MATAKARSRKHKPVSGKALAWDKALISNKAALTAKYGPAGFASVHAALVAVVASDKKRTIRTTIVYLDDATSLKPFGATPIKSVSDQKGTKAAIDKISSSATELVLIGAGDVVSFQDLDNLLWTGNRKDDPDQFVASDLPYACASPYSKKIASFLSPSRIVSRIPDLARDPGEGVTEPTYLEGLLDTVKIWQRWPAGKHKTAFVLSADDWSGATTATSTSLFGKATTVHMSPARGPAWPAADLSPRFHFINCHGSQATPKFFGQRGTATPTAHEASDIATKVSAGAIVAAECCYGCDLYNPIVNPPMGICSMYLRESAYGFMGSTTVSYGPATAPNGYADLICEYFIQEVQAGRTIGRAMLNARKTYIATSGTLDSAGLKTIAQFLLLGDASIQPIVSTKTPSGARHPKTAVGGGGGFAAALPKSGRGFAESISNGLVLGFPAFRGPIEVASPVETSSTAETLFQTFAKAQGLTLGGARSTEVVPLSEVASERAVERALGATLPKGVSRKGLSAKPRPAARIHFAFASAPTASAKAGAEPVPTARCALLIVREHGGVFDENIVTLWQKS